MISVASSVREVGKVAVDLEIDLADSAATEDREVALETAEDKMVDLETDQVAGVEELVDSVETNAEVDVGERNRDSARRQAFNELPFVACVHQAADLSWLCSIFRLWVYKTSKECMNSEMAFRAAGIGWVDHCRAFWVFRQRGFC